MAIQQVFTPVQAGAQFLGWADKTCRNKLTAGQFPFPVREFAGKKIVLLTDIEAVLLAAPVVAGPEPLPDPQQADQQPGRVRRGPPTAVERARAGAAGLTIKELRQQEACERGQHAAP